MNAMRAIACRCALSCVCASALLVRRPGGSPRSRLVLGLPSGECRAWRRRCRRLPAATPPKWSCRCRRFRRAAPATVMDQIAKGFTDPEIQAIAAWYAHSDESGGWP